MSEQTINDTNNSNVPAEKKRKKTLSVYRMVVCALLAAVLCILGPFSIPIGPIPISLGLLGILLATVVLEPIDATLSVIIYLLLGLIGLPVFSNFGSGFIKLVGPTGGYLWSYVFVALAAGYLIKLFRKKLPGHGAGRKVLLYILTFISCLVGIAICYAFGTLYFAYYQGVTISQALAVCVIPFIGFDIAKAALATILGTIIRKLIKYEIKIK